VKIGESIHQALKNIVSSKMRAFLTMLGIIIGIAAVMVIVGFGNGMENYMKDQFESMGTNTLTVTINGRGSSRSVSEDDMYQIVEDNSEYLDKISPTVSVSSTVKIDTETLDSTSVTGVNEEYFSIKDYGISDGRALQYLDMVNRQRVCVVGAYIAQEYYADDAVGQKIRIGGNKFTIIGVLNQQVDEMEEGSTDDMILLPYTTAARVLSAGTISNYTIMLTSEDFETDGKAAIEDALYSIFESEDAYRITSMSEMLEMMTSMTNIIIAIMTAIAGISLLVGGIGIMNIMLVSVTERTREIGIRKALGAKERFIMTQFVIESAVISAMGGLIGIAAGYGISAIATQVVGAVLDVSMTIVPSAASVVIAFGISVAIGILFGYLPAKKASRLNPIDALRYE